MSTSKLTVRTAAAIKTQGHVGGGADIDVPETGIQRPVVVERNIHTSLRCQTRRSSSRDSFAELIPRAGRFSIRKPASAGSTSSLKNAV
jgi:hypothetical protein